MRDDARRSVLHDDVRSTFDRTRFSLRRLPAPVGALEDAATLDDLPSCLDMLVMLPGGHVVLPEPYRSAAAVTGFVKDCTAHEDALLPAWRDDRHLYLTVDRRRVVPGRTHRNAGWHFDGMQGARYPDKLAACHQYVASTALPTEFTDRATDAATLDELADNWFERLGDQIPADAPTWSPSPMDIVCMSAWQIHRSPVAAEAGWRTFLRLDVSMKRQDRLGNTPNPDLRAPFAYVPRSLPEGLGRSIRDASWKDAAVFNGATR